MRNRPKRCCRRGTGLEQLQLYIHVSAHISAVFHHHLNRAYSAPEHTYRCFGEHMKIGSGDRSCSRQEQKHEFIHNFSPTIRPRTATSRPPALDPESTRPP